MLLHLLVIRLAGRLKFDNSSIQLPVGFFYLCVGPIFAKMILFYHEP